MKNSSINDSIYLQVYQRINGLQPRLSQKDSKKADYLNSIFFEKYYTGIWAKSKSGFDN
jgi:hypothetical protein